MRNISTIPKTVFIYGCSVGGLSFELLKHLDTTIVSLFFKKFLKKNQKEEEKKMRKKEKEREDIHNQSINHWYPTHLSCILEGLYG